MSGRRRQDSDWVSLTPNTGHFTPHSLAPVEKKLGDFIQPLPSEETVHRAMSSPTPTRMSHALMSSATAEVPIGPLGLSPGEGSSEGTHTSWDSWIPPTWFAVVLLGDEAPPTSCLSARPKLE